MTINNFESNPLSYDEKIDFREVLAAFRRRWIWVASGGMLGIAIAGFSLLTPVAKKPSLEKNSIRMVVDVSLGPCYSAKRSFKEYVSETEQTIACTGDFNTYQYQLRSLASKKFALDKSFDFSVKPLTLGGSGQEGRPSSTQAVLEVSFDEGNLPDARAKIREIKRDFSADQISNTKRLSGNSEVQTGKGWISIEDNPAPNESKNKPESKSSARSLAFGLLSGLFMGSGAALIADRRSDRVFSNSRILEQLGYPLWLTLPKLPWSDQMVSPLIGQLATRLDPSLEWYVLSIALENEVVGPLAEAITCQSEPGLSCKAVAPLLNSIIRLGSDTRLIGLLVVVESGFNSSQALEDASLLLSQLACVHSIGVVLAGVPLPSELTMGEKA